MLDEIAKEENMGNGLLRLVKERVSKEQSLAFWGTSVLVLLIHLYKFTNTLPNHDSVYNYYSDQNILGSGRWALSMACGLSSYFDLPFVIGLFCAVYIGFTAAVIISLFQIKNPVVILLCGGLLAAAPATTETFFFLFTADGYMLAMLLSALAVWWSRIGEDRWIRHILSGLCVCVSCGIYQAYVSFALLLAVCYFLCELLKNSHPRREYFRWIWRQLVIYSLSLAAYYAIWKWMLFITETAANDYQGISSVGLNVNTIVTGFVRSVKAVLLYFLQWNILEHGVTLYSVLSILTLVSLGLGLVMSFWKSGAFRRGWTVALAVICFLVIIPFACIWNFVSDRTGYRPMMLQALSVLFILNAVLYEQWAKPWAKDLVGLLLAIVVLQNGIMANISYFYMNLCYERTYAQSVEMVIKIHEIESTEHFEKVAVIGTREEYFWLSYDDEVGKVLPPGEAQLLTNLLENTLLIDDEHTVLFLNGTMGLELLPVEREEQQKLAQTDIVASMPCWPTTGSIQVIDEVLVIKLGEAQ